MRRRWLLKGYVGVVCLAGAVGLAGAVKEWSRVEVGSWELGLFVGLAGVLDLMVVPVAGGGGAAASFAVLFGGLLVLGPGPSAWVAALAGLWSEGVVRRTAGLRVGFNVGHSVVSLLAAGWVYGALGGVVGRVRLPEDLGAVVGAAGTLWLLESGWVAGAVALEGGRGIGPGLRARLKPMLALDGALAAVGLLLALLYQSRGELVGPAQWRGTEALFWVGVGLVPCWLLFYAYRLQGHLRGVYAQSLQTLGELTEAKLGSRQPGHGEAVARLAAAMAQALELPPQEVERVRFAGYLHDIGKVGVPGAYLQGSRDLFCGEPEPVRQHPEIGAQILGAIRFLAPVAELVRAHHERWDGLGYPRGLRGPDIPLGARLLAIANAYVGMTHPLAPAPLSPQQALSRLRQAAGSRFDPQLVEVLGAACQLDNSRPGSPESRELNPR